MTVYEVVNTTTGTVLTKPCPREVADSICEWFATFNGYTYEVVAAGYLFS